MTHYESEFDQAVRTHFAPLLEKVRHDLSTRHGLATDVATSAGPSGPARSYTLLLHGSTHDSFRIEYTPELGSRFIGTVAGLHVVPALSTHAVPGIDSLRVAVAAWLGAVGRALKHGKIRPTRVPAERAS